ncbi:MAG: arylsulfatase, partial [Lentisphaerae bacterium]
MKRSMQFCTLAANLLLLGKTTAASSPPPNIVFILADDLGYGDVHCLNPQRGKIPTPNLDKLATEGMIFTDAHSASAVCTPSRYSILTGRYNWRTHLQSGVLFGFSPPLIAKERLTVAELLKKNGYSTACIGKWHLGLELPYR